jgi:hypothetical protein
MSNGKVVGEIEDCTSVVPHDVRDGVPKGGYVELLLF